MKKTGWTGNSDADSALVMLGRLDYVDPDDDVRMEAIEQIIRKMAVDLQLAQALTRSWIPVSELMPENDVSVLTFDGMYKRVHHAMYGHWQCWEPEKITHWMPLPAPPQEVK